MSRSDSGERTGALAKMLAAYVASTDDERIDVGRIRALPAGLDRWSRSTPLHVTASALIVDRATQRVLLRWHARQQSWIQVGGHADSGEDDPLVIALREGAEESGLTDLAPWPGLNGPIHIVVVPVPAGAEEPAHEHADVRYVLATDEAHRARPETDGAPLRWLSFDEAAQLTGEENVRETLARGRRTVRW